MRRFILILILFYIFIPALALASCSKEGFTVIYVNGIFTDKEKAKGDTKAIRTDFSRKSGRTDTVFINGYNPSHVGGLGDVAQVVWQASGSSISDFDLKTILMQAHSEITTQKILLVGHSQGTFYTNEMYNYLTTHGVAEESIAVYNIATPASSVSGVGKYLTSGNDNLINTVREWTAAVDVPQPLTANILIPLSHPEVEELWRGHAFSGEYLTGGSGVIVSDINNLLNELNAEDDVGVEGGGCYEAPTGTFSYKMQKYGFAVADPAALVIRDTVVTTGKTIAAVGSLMVSGVVIAIDTVNDSFSRTSSLESLVAEEESESDSTSTKTIFELELPAVPDDTLPKEIVTEEEETVESEGVAVEGEGAVETPSLDEEIPAFVPDVLPNVQPVFVPDLGGNSAEVHSQSTNLLVAPVISSPVSETSFATSSVTFSGTATSDLIISQDFSSATTTVDSDSNWSLTLSSFSQGTTTVAFTASDNEQDSESTSVDVFIDTVAPTLDTFTVLECTYSLSLSGCLLMDTDVNLSWSSSSTDILYYGIAVNSIVNATTTATTTSVTIANNTITTLSVVVYDSYMNSATSSVQTIEVFSSPVVINEVAWAGTNVSSSDEWIELFNPTSKNIDLSDWVLSSEDSVPYFNLEDTISAGGYYLIERSEDDMTVSDITADLATAFSGVLSGSGLSNSGEHLLLEYVSQEPERATSTVDETPVLSLCGSNSWCGGNSSLKSTMERISSNVSGADYTNWASSLGEFILNGEDASGSPIKGTPRQENSAPRLISQTGSLTMDKTLNKAGSPYLITRSGLTVSEGVTLNIDPGVVVKFVAPNEPSLIINGTLTTNGTQSEPVVFTAFSDDTYGGDMNGDSDSTSPTSASWKQIVFNTSSVDSALAHTFIRYGGRWFDNMLMRAMVVVDNTDVSFDNVVVESSGKHGIYLNNSSSQITNSTFKSNNVVAGASGIYVYDGDPTITNNIFEDNKYGISVLGAPSISVSSNTFTNNSTEAIDVMGAIGSFVSNTGSGNSLNAIVVSGNITDSGVGTTTLLTNSLPYLIDSNVNVVSGSTLEFSQGVVVKGSGGHSGRLSVKDGGKLFYNSLSASDIVFTSIHDDSVGGAVDNDATPPSPGDWYGIKVEEGGLINMSGFTFKYGGGYINQMGGYLGGIEIAGNSATSTISKALFEDNFKSGLYLFEASVVVSDTVFNNHTEERLGTASAIYLLESLVELSNIVFSGNDLDIQSLGVSTVSCINCGEPVVSPEDLLD